MDEKKLGCHPQYGSMLFGVVGLLVVIAVLLAVNMYKPVEFKPVVNTGSTTVQNTLSVSGNALLSAAPDQAIAYINIVTDDENAKTAQSANRETSNAVVDALKSWGVDTSSIETDSYSLSKKQEWVKENGTYVDVGYRLTHTLKVTTERVDEVGDMVDVAVNAGANGVDGVTFSLSKDKEKQVRDQALERAITAAKEKAQRMASTAGVTLGKVTSVSEQNFYYTPYEYNTRNSYNDLAAMAAPSPISPQTVEVSSSVSLAYELA